MIRYRPERSAYIDGEKLLMINVNRTTAPRAFILLFWIVAVKTDSSIYLINKLRGVSIHMEGQMIRTEEEFVAALIRRSEKEFADKIAAAFQKEDEEPRRKLPLRMRTKINAKADICFITDILSATSICLERLGLVQDVRLMIASLVMEDIKKDGRFLGCCRKRCREKGTDPHFDTVIHDDFEPGSYFMNFCSEKCQKFILERYLSCDGPCKKTISYNNPKTYLRQIRLLKGRCISLCLKCEYLDLLKNGIVSKDISRDRLEFLSTAKDFEEDDLQKNGFSVFKRFNLDEEDGDCVENRYLEVVRLLEETPSAKIVLRRDMKTTICLDYSLWIKKDSNGASAEPELKKIKDI